MKIANYCVGSLKDLQDMSHLDCCQVVMPSGHPSKVNVLRDLVAYTDLYAETDVIYHYSLIYIASRYAYMNDSTRRAMCDSLYGLMMFDNARVRGVVLHTDWPIKKSVMRDSSKLDTEYSGNLWDRQRITDAMTGVDATERSIAELYADLKARFNTGAMHISDQPVRKLYLENTTKLGPSHEGTVDYLIDLIMRHEWYDLFGVCIDTEHEYSATGLDYCDVNLLEDIPSEIDIVYHLNCVPEEVRPCSRLDRHSNTTVFECSVRPVEKYEQIIEVLNSEAIPWVREIYSETAYRESCQLGQYNAERLEHINNE